MVWMEQHFAVLLAQITHRQPAAEFTAGRLVATVGFDALFDRCPRGFRPLPHRSSSGISAFFSAFLCSIDTTAKKGLKIAKLQISANYALHYGHFYAVKLMELA